MLVALLGSRPRVLCAFVFALLDGVERCATLMMVGTTKRRRAYACPAREGGGAPDEESFRLVLRACLVDHDDDFRDDDDPGGTTSGGGEEEESRSASSRRRRAREMGSGVAVRLWNREMRDNDHRRVDGIGSTASRRYDSDTYRDLIRAICQSSDLPSSITTRALSSLASAYARCGKDGMITPEITDLVESATTAAQFARLRDKIARI